MAIHFTTDTKSRFYGQFILIRRSGSKPRKPLPQDIDLNGENLPAAPPPPLIRSSPTYDVPRGGKPRSCLTDKQLNFRD